MEPPNLYPVKLYVYDLSKGLARRLSPIMLGEGTGVSGVKAGGRQHIADEEGKRDGPTGGRQDPNIRARKRVGWSA